MARPSKFDYDQVVSLIAEKGRTLVSIEKELGMHKTYLARWCKRHKINHGRTGRENQVHDYSQVITLTKEGMALYLISEKLKIPYSSLCAYCKRHGISYIAKGRGSNYDYNQIAILIAKEEMTLTSIAEELGISISAFSHYCKRHKIDHRRTGKTGRKYNYDDVKINKLIKKGMPLSDISEKLEIPYGYLRAYCRRNEISCITKSQELLCVSSLSQKRKRYILKKV